MKRNASYGSKDQLQADLARLEHSIEVCHALIKAHTPQTLLFPAFPQRKPSRIPLPPGLEEPPPLPPSETLLDEDVRALINAYPGMLFDAGPIGRHWLAGYTLDKQQLVLVPDELYSSYEQACLREVGWNDDLEEMDDLEEEDEAEDATPPHPLYRRGVWKARQVAHWVGDTDTPELDYPIWSNGTWG